MLRSTIATTLRRLEEPRRRRTAAGGLLLGSLGLLGGMWLLLPDPHSATPTVREDTVGTATSALLSGPDQVILPLPGEGGVQVETLLRHRLPDVEVLDATVVNTDQVTAELDSEVPGATRLMITSTAVHACDRYAGSVVVTSRHPDTRRDHLFIDLRFADCEGITAVPAAPASVNDTSRTWGGDGRAPWYSPPQPDPRPPSTDSDPSASDPTPAPTATAEPTGEPTGDSSPAPAPTAEPTAEPTSQPTSDGGGDSDGDGGGAGDEDTGGDGSSSGDTSSGSSTDTSGTASGSDPSDG